jgi:type I restriction enzyme S subunit
MNNITPDNRFDFSSYVKVDATAPEAERFSLHDGDFLFNTRNSHELVGKVCIYEARSDEMVVFNNNIMRVRFRSGIDSRFVLHAFSSTAVAEGLESLKSGTTNVSAIYYKDLRLLRIPIPPDGVQQELASQLDGMNAETQRLASIYQQKLAALDELKKSLLHQAFSGEL